MKKTRVLKISISASLIILVLLRLFNIINSKLVHPIALLTLGCLNISNGYSAYINNKKREATFLISGGIFIIFVSVLMAILKKGY